MFSRKETALAPSGVHNVLSSGTVFTGNLITQDDIRIDGTIEGNITSQGKIIIGNNGHISGDIECQMLDVLGKTTGNILCHETALIRESAIINGDIVSKALEVEPGARITGYCKPIE